MWAAEDVPPGTRYGPFLGKWTAEPADQRFAWEVSYFAGRRAANLSHGRRSPPSVGKRGTLTKKE